MKKILVLGSGGREHALVWALSKKQWEIFALPGNPGIAGSAELINAEPLDFNFIKEKVKKKNIEYIIPGPELPLVQGIKDTLANISFVYGPSKKSAQLEGSKSFAKEFMSHFNIPTPFFEIFTEPEKAYKYIEKKGVPIVIKADGLAAGKGSIIVYSLESAKETLYNIMEKKIFGEAGNTVLVEEYLKGVEVSIHALVAGDEYLLLLPSQDHKPVYDQDKGPNTGGMGAYAPCSFITSSVFEIIEDKIIKETVKGLHKKGFDYQGVIYAGVMITKKGPYVLEYNVRFGDPEAQPILWLLETDLGQIIEKTKDFRLNEIKLKWKSGFAILVVLASRGYPGSYEKNKIISGLEKVKGDDVFVFHSGTKKVNNEILTNGGRVLGVLGYGSTLEQARKTAYNNIEKISFDGMHYRKDIGEKGFKSLDELLEF